LHPVQGEREPSPSTPPRFPSTAQPASSPTPAEPAPAGISTSRRGGGGGGGSITLLFGNTLSMQGGSAITTTSLLADGGNISITSTGSTLSLFDSQITTSVQSGVGQGGNIALGSGLHPLDFLIMSDGQIRADAFGGPGGNIRIFADTFLTSGSI